MADPLSVAASITGLLAAAGNVATALYMFAEAPALSQRVMREVHDIGILLRQLHSLINCSKSQQSLIMVEDLLALLTSLVLTFSELEKLVDGVGSHGLVDRGKWALMEPELEKLLLRLQSQKSSLTLMLSVLQCRTVQEAYDGIEALSNAMDRLLKTTDDIRRRLQSMQASGIPGVGTHASRARSSSTSSIKSFNSILRKTRVYLRADDWNSVHSYSSEKRSGRWSVLSGVSWCKISNISVLGLPVYAHEIHNNYHYCPPIPSPDLSDLGGTERWIKFLEEKYGKLAIHGRFDVLGLEGFQQQETQNLYIYLFEEMLLFSKQGFPGIPYRFIPAKDIHIVKDGYAWEYENCIKILHDVVEPGAVTQAKCDIIIRDEEARRAWIPLLKNLSDRGWNARKRAKTA